jgi:hypothetical protein
MRAGLFGGTAVIMAILAAIIGAFIAPVGRENLISIMLLSQVINGVLLPVIIFFMLRITSDRGIMGPHVNSRWFNITALGRFGAGGGNEPDDGGDELQKACCLFKELASQFTFDFDIGNREVFILLNRQSDHGQPLAGQSDISVFFCAAADRSGQK